MLNDLPQGHEAWHSTMLSDLIKLSALDSSPSFQIFLARALMRSFPGNPQLLGGLGLESYQIWGNRGQIFLFTLLSKEARNILRRFTLAWVLGTLLVLNHIEELIDPVLVLIAYKRELLSSPLDLPSNNWDRIVGWWKAYSWFLLNQLIFIDVSLIFFLKLLF